jgi:peptidoglycan/xylan/chitin deacetylase (PgdA/CDA1 family)
MVFSVAMSFFPNSGFHLEKVSSHRDRNSKKIMLSFDDGPHPQYSEKILDVLREHKISAVFFIIGKHVPGNEQILHRMIREGHVIANHSHTHSVLWDLWPTARMSEDIEKCSEIIHSVTGLRPAWFRPPYGVINPMVAKAVLARGMAAVTWSFRSFDTNTKEENRLVEKTIKGVRGGDILLFHDSLAVTASGLGKIIVSLQKKGFEFAGPEDFLRKKAYADC